MDEEKQVNLLDFAVLFVKYKRFLLITALLTMIISYLAIYFFVEEKFDATATIIPVEDSPVSGVAGFLKNFPIDIAGGGFSSTEMSMYNTIINSRTLLEKVIEKFDLINVYELDMSDPEYMEKALKNLRSSITAKETEDNAYEITVRANTPEHAALITNYLVQLLNERIIELKISKSAQNRMFLEDRLKDIRYSLKTSEDSLMFFQKKTGLLSSEEQLKGIMDAYSTLETELITRQIQASILKEVLGENDPRIRGLEIEADKFEKRLSEIKSKGQPNSPLLSISSLPQTTIDYLRLFREVEIGNAILEFVIPLYEQAKFEEQKNIPILQVVDYAVPPVKRSYPTRTIFALLITIVIFFIVFIFILVKENESLKGSAKMDYIRKNLFRWRNF